MVSIATLIVEIRPCEQIEMRRRVRMQISRLDLLPNRDWTTHGTGCHTCCA